MKLSQLAIDQLEQAIQRMPDNALSDNRAAAVRSLGALGLPTTRHEDWKYTDLAAAIRVSNRWLEAGATNATSDAVAAAITAVSESIDADWIIIANGDIDTSQLENISSLSIERYSNSGAPLSNEKPLGHLNAALLKDGLRIQIHAATEKPLGLLIVDDAHTAPSVSQINLSIDVVDGCDAEIVEYHTSLGSDDSYCNAVISLDVGSSARASYVRIQDRQLHHIQTTRLAISMAAASELRMATFDLGGGLVRNDIDIDINEPGANAIFDGLYLAGEGQHIDNHTRVDHRVGPATSSQEYRGILKGDCRCVWNGKAIVHEGADGTDANQANHNLLLSEKAEIDTKPELEIYADEVKCSHGTTVGQLDAAALFYLTTRGIEQTQARQLLTQAFAANIVQRTPIESARVAVENRVNTRLQQMIQDS